MPEDYFDGIGNWHGNSTENDSKGWKACFEAMREKHDRKKKVLEKIVNESGSLQYVVWLAEGALKEVI